MGMLALQECFVSGNVTLKKKKKHKISHTYGNLTLIGPTSILLEILVFSLL
jgi:hypothetical protein